MKRWLATLGALALALLAAAAPVLGQTGPISLVVDGRLVPCDVPPEIVRDRVLVPIRAVSEALGCTVTWDAEKRQVIVTTASTPGGPAGTEQPAGGSASVGIDVPRLFAAASASVVAILCYTDDGQGGPPEIEGWGSGFVASADGLVFTNAHVIKGATQITVLFPDGRAVDVGVPSGRIYDERSDVAVLRLGVSGLTPLPLGDSDEVVVGEPVIAIGNPATMQLRNTVTAGIISGVGRGLGDYYPYLQTDAAINPGNSGGPLINARGEVVGMTSMKFVDPTIEGLAFAVPINVVREIAVELLVHGRVIRPWLGISVDESWEAAHGLPTTEGLRIVSVSPGGPAARAGVRAGDYLMAVDGVPTNSIQDLCDILIACEVGRTVTLSLRRAGVSGPLLIQVVLGEAPN